MLVPSLAPCRVPPKHYQESLLSIEQGMASESGQFPWTSQKRRWWEIKKMEVSWMGFLNFSVMHEQWLTRTQNIKISKEKHHSKYSVHQNQLRIKWWEQTRTRINQILNRKLEAGNTTQWGYYRRVSDSGNNASVEQVWFCHHFSHRIIYGWIYI